MWILGRKGLILAHKLFPPSIVSHLTPTNHCCLDINRLFQPTFPPPLSNHYIGWFLAKMQLKMNKGVY